MTSLLPNRRGLLLEVTLAGTNAGLAFPLGGLTGAVLTAIAR